MVEELVRKKIKIDDTNPGIVRINEKCVNCGLCKICCVNKVGMKCNETLDNPICLNCGQCILACPYGALKVRNEYQEVKNAIDNKNKVVVVLTSPAVRVSIGDMFGMDLGSLVEGKMISALKMLGFDYVFDTSFGADLTIMEEATELLDRIKTKKNLPLFTSCCPAWVKYVEHLHPELINNLSTTKSPISMQSAILKNYFTKVKNIKREDLVVVALAPCTAKKYEKTLYKDTDYVITTSEFGAWLKEKDIDFKELNDKKYDKLFSRGSSAGVMFGSTGGVMSAALREVYYMLTQEEAPQELIQFNYIREYDYLKEAIVHIDDYTLNIAVVHTLANLEKLLESDKYKKYDFIEVMNCPGGCVGGGGQPMLAEADKNNVYQKRMNSLNNYDKITSVRCAHKNKDIINIYKKYLLYPKSNLAEYLLHTRYVDRSQKEV